MTIYKTGLERTSSRASSWRMLLFPRCWWKTKQIKAKRAKLPWTWSPWLPFLSRRQKETIWRLIS